MLWLSKVCICRPCVMHSPSSCLAIRALVLRSRHLLIEMLISTSEQQVKIPWSRDHSLIEVDRSTCVRSTRFDLAKSPPEGGRSAIASISCPFSWSLTCLPYLPLDEASVGWLGRLVGGLVVFWKCFAYRCADECHIHHQLPHHVPQVVSQILKFIIRSLIVILTVFSPSRFAVHIYVNLSWTWSISL